MKIFGRVTSVIVAVSLIGFILLAQRSYQLSWSGNAVAPAAAAAGTGSAAASFATGVETIVMK